MIVHQIAFGVGIFLALITVAGGNPTTRESAIGTTVVAAVASALLAWGWP